MSELSKKRPATDEEPAASGSKRIKVGEHASVVASHYNTLEEKGVEARKKSKIFFMRNFNNWTKAILITEFIEKLRRDGCRYLTVLDMCCGKGGDLLKWQKANISHLICTDIAEVSVNQAEERYNSTRSRQRGRLFTAEFIACDATQTNQRDLYKDKDVKIDLVSCQFAFHYCFESLPQARQMLKNASDCLKPGGYFIGTIPDANEIMIRQKEAGDDKFGNKIYEIKLLFDLDEPPPLFGAKYDFHLEEVVDCPEFLVHFPTLVKLAEQYDLTLVKRQSFVEFYQENIGRGKGLMEKMRGLETFTLDSKDLSYDDQEEYAHAREILLPEKEERDKVEESGSYSRTQLKVGTLSKSEWDVICK